MNLDPTKLHGEFGILIHDDAEALLLHARSGLRATQRRRNGVGDVGCVANGEDADTEA